MSIRVSISLVLTLIVVSLALSDANLAQPAPSGAPVAETGLTGIPFRSDSTTTDVAAMEHPTVGAVQESGQVIGSQESNRSPLFPSEQVSRRRPIQTQDADLPIPAVSKPASGSQNQINVEFCTVRFVDEIRLPALETGAIEEILVEEGQAIPAGQVVGRIDDQLLLMELEQAELRYAIARDQATDTTSIEAAVKEFELAKIEAGKTNRLYQRGSRSESELMEAEFRVEIAKLKQQKAQKDRDTALGEARVEMSRMEIVKTRISRHVLKSNYNAYVVEILKKPQEFVNTGDDVLRLGRMDELWVQGNVSVEQLNENDALNRPVTVTYPLADGQSVTFTGRIDQVSLERQSSDQYAVKVKVKNRPAGNGWLLRPFARASMVIHLDRGLVEDPVPATADRDAP